MVHVTSAGTQHVVFRNWIRRIFLALVWFVPAPVLFASFGETLGTPITLVAIAACWVLGVRALRSGIRIENNRVTIRGILRSYSLRREEIASIGIADAVTLRFADCVLVDTKSRGSIKCVSLDPKRPDLTVLRALQSQLLEAT